LQATLQKRLLYKSVGFSISFPQCRQRHVFFSAKFPTRLSVVVINDKIPTSSILRGMINLSIFVLENKLEKNEMLGKIPQKNRIISFCLL